MIDIKERERILEDLLARGKVSPKVYFEVTKFKTGEKVIVPGTVIGNFLDMNAYSYKECRLPEQNPVPGTPPKEAQPIVVNVQPGEVAHVRTDNTEPQPPAEKPKPVFQENKKQALQSK